jgi:ATP-binding protein involved in chromosome partitioning
MATVEEIKQQLSKVIYPGFTKDIVTFGFVKSVEVDGSSVSILVDISSSAAEVAAQLRDDILKELALIGVENPNLSIKQPQAPKEQSNSRSGKNIAPQIKNFIMVSSGKGGVGKSTTTVNLAIALAMQGKKVGVLDADIYGPNIPRMLGVAGVQPEIVNNQVIPLKAYGLEVMSMGLLLEEGQSLIWRGSMIMKAIEQFLKDIKWGELDVLVIDMPPGTGDAQLTLAQSVPVTAGINVTTPQNVALDDSRRSLDMFKKLHIPIAGVIENMSGFICPECSTESDIFGKGTCDELVKEFDTVVLGDIPIEPAIREGGDGGKPVVYFSPDSISAKRYQMIAHKTWQEIERINESGGASNEAIQPTTPSGVSACSTQAQSSSSSCSSGSCGCS